jgi:hypothetical protein
MIQWYNIECRSRRKMKEDVKFCVAHHKLEFGDLANDTTVAKGQQRCEVLVSNKYTVINDFPILEIIVFQNIPIIK